jgi:catechol 2,3-dioxygenase-like lactoylglutathione lyase family enzyme
MTVLRIISNIPAVEPQAAVRFYRDLLGLEVVMDHGWIMTFAGCGVEHHPQVSVASEGGSGTLVPDLSIEVDNVDEVYQSAQKAGFEIVYPLSLEPWGVYRFYVRDPFGKIINILSHVPRA